MDEIHVHKTKKSICAHFAESACRSRVLENFKPHFLKMTLCDLSTFRTKLFNYT